MTRRHRLARLGALAALVAAPGLAGAAPGCKKGQVADAAGKCVDACPAGMQYVPGGTFTMGDPKADDDRGPAHEVTLSPYCIDTYEVTAKAYAACQKDGACSETQTYSGCNVPREKFADHPANCVTWEQARDYCAHVGKRLPTEAEWEMAARGTDGRRFPWGNQKPTLSRAHWSTGGHLYIDTVKPGSKKGGASPYGVQDMAGNVCELVSDVWAPRYPSGAQTDPQGAASGEYHVCRGGSYNNRDADAISATMRRHGYSTGSTDELTGFRCAMACTAGK
ncbi:MAG: SUMF1/EgtB/PvdO family nonheme iron enzyme [Deltaproteobacteria bacterium]|nr:SUMF1/EgtB/PvdO family nonheme iron enzyme [Deltaproteobacteria bacterium]